MGNLSYARCSGNLSPIAFITCMDQKLNFCYLYTSTNRPLQIHTIYLMFRIVWMIQEACLIIELSFFFFIAYIFHIFFIIFTLFSEKAEQNEYNNTLSTNSTHNTQWLWKKLHHYVSVFFFIFALVYFFAHSYHDQP